MYILPELQSKGIGSKLISLGIKELEGIKRLFVIVEKENTIGKTITLFDVMNNKKVKEAIPQVDYSTFGTASI